MASGPLFPNSSVPDITGLTFPLIFAGDGANHKHEDTLGVAASIGSDTVWYLRFLMPPALPTGTCKLRLLALSTATSGSAKVNPKWASVAVGESPSAAALNAEGTATITWSSSSIYMESKITLDADTPVAGEIIALALVFETSGWTLAQVSGWIPSIIWE